MKQTLTFESPGEATTWLKNNGFTGWDRKAFNGAGGHARWDNAFARYAEGAYYGSRNPCVLELILPEEVSPEARVKIDNRIKEIIKQKADLDTELTALRQL